MHKPRIFIGSSGKQQKLLQALTRGLDDVAHVEPWTTVFNPGTTTLGRLLELTREVDFAAFVFAHSIENPVWRKSLPAEAASTAVTARPAGGACRRSATSASAPHAPVQRVQLSSSPTA